MCFFRTNQLNEVWRIEFEDAVGKKLYKKIVRALLAQLDRLWPAMAPWGILDMEKVNGGTRTRNFLQIYRQPGAQPVHLDSGVTWYLDSSRKPWCPLSVVLNITDGLETWVSKKPFVGVFYKMAQAGVNQGAKRTASALQEILSTSWESERKDTVLRRNRAGQCVAFHPGEYPHSGNGWDGVPDPIVKEWTGRVIAYWFAVPKIEIDNIWDLSLFGAEEAWGLMEPGIQPKQVFFFLPHNAHFCGIFVLARILWRLECCCWNFGCQSLFRSKSY